ncbi:PaaI family thioesterase [Opitutus terrae]|uniref:Thioesterase superfamily protein n=1 Tax=Opitutus terrae (strain DSM 11246 / JCM 15787 / PB90-1) TaxID=452637 RepID=B1ZNR7_OPITP|nr:PaaI family thioesterase [Opitutus terrae]ACB75437.1 thioesterase superfamily protein [Opitutus terrae PB90-1]
MHDTQALKDFLQKGDQFARHCGLELVSVAPGRAIARLAVQPHHLNAIGLVQGGAIFTLADFAFAAASNSHGTVAVGINVSITYQQAARSGVLTAEAQEVARHPKLASYTVNVRDAAGQLVAIFQGLVYRKQEPTPPARAPHPPTDGS